MSLYFNTRAIDHFLFLKFIISSKLERHTVLFCAMSTHSSPMHWATYCLLPPPDSETTSIALCAHFLLQAPKPCHMFLQKLSCLPLRISRRDSSNVPTPRQVAGRVGFITMWELLFCPEVTHHPCPSCHVRFSAILGASWYVNHLSKHAVQHIAQMCALGRFGDRPLSAARCTLLPLFVALLATSR